MLKIVIAKPTQFTMVSEVPLVSAGVFCAIKVEKSGESAITEMPQINKNVKSKTTELVNINNGENKQHIPDKNREIIAIFFAPKRCEINPLTTQETAPDAIIKNEISGTFRFALG